MPGYWVTVFTIDRLGRKTIQLMGFAMMTIFLAALAGGYDELKEHRVKRAAPTFFIIAKTPRSIRPPPRLRTAALLQLLRSGVRPWRSAAAARLSQHAAHLSCRSAPCAAVVAGALSRCTR